MKDVPLSGKPGKIMDAALVHIGWYQRRDKQIVRALNAGNIDKAVKLVLGKPPKHKQPIGW